MTNKKISALSAASLPLTGAEILPAVQSSATVNFTVANLQAAPIAAQTVNCVIYLNGTKIPTTANLFSFDGTNLGVGTSSPSTYGQFALVGTGAPTAFIGGNVNAGGVVLGTLRFGSTANSNAYIDYGGQIRSYTVGGIDQCDLRFYVGNGAAATEAARFDHLKNLTFSTAAKGINFTANTPAAGMTSQLLNWYEEGTWTPNQGAGLTVVGVFSSNGTYVRIGRSITVKGQVLGATTVAVTAAGVISSNLPFTAASSHAGSMYNAAIAVGGAIAITSTSATAASEITATPSITFTATYQV
jgi:hypothetical protein